MASSLQARGENAADYGPDGASNGPNGRGYSKIQAPITKGESITDNDVDHGAHTTGTEALNGATGDERVHGRRKSTKQTPHEEYCQGNKNDGLSPPYVSYRAVDRGDGGVGKDEGAANPNVTGDGAKGGGNCRNGRCDDSKIQRRQSYG